MCAARSCATAAARTNHPVVVTVFAYGTDLELGADYLVMEQLEGESLEARLERAGPLQVFDRESDSRPRLTSSRFPADDQA